MWTESAATSQRFPVSTRRDVSRRRGRRVVLLLLFHLPDLHISVSPFLPLHGVTSKRPMNYSNFTENTDFFLQHNAYCIIKDKKKTTQTYFYHLTTTERPHRTWTDFPFNGGTLTFVILLMNHETHRRGVQKAFGFVQLQGLCATEHVSLKTNLLSNHRGTSTCR